MPDVRSQVFHWTLVRVRAVYYTAVLRSIDTQLTHRALLVCQILLEIFKHVNDIDRHDPIMMLYVKVSLVRTSLAALASCNDV